MPKIPKINEQNEIIGETTIAEAKENSWPRRIIRIYILNPERTHVLLQLRSEQMQSYPNTWDQAVGGHVDVGESYFEAAAREMNEEIGINGDLEEICGVYQMPKTFDAIYRVIIPIETKLQFDPHEVSDMKWWTIEDFENDFNKNPDNHTLGTIKVWNDFRDTLLA